LETLADQAGTIFVDPKSDVRRSALANIIQLCLVFGRTKTNDVLLIRMITYLNDQDWRLRCTFLESIVSVAAFVGATSLEEFVLPLMEQALAGKVHPGSVGRVLTRFVDPEDYVVSRVLISLSSLIELGLFEKARILELFSRTYGFLCHPNAWVRQGESPIGVVAHR
jgi:phosphoinositide-3-kinase regulatory subunit 4